MYWSLGKAKIDLLEPISWEKQTSRKDLGVIVMNNMSPWKHINKIVRETYNLLKNIKVAFSYTDQDMMKKIIVTRIRPRLEYTAVVWSLNLKKNINLSPAAPFLITCTTTEVGFEIILLLRKGNPRGPKPKKNGFKVPAL